MAKNYIQGFYSPINPNKYAGNAKQIVYRSSYELKLMLSLDTDDSVVQWGSEEVVIPYRSPIDNRIHNYFVDFIVTKINSKGVKETVLIEVKPKRETVPPEVKNKKTKKYLTEVARWGINDAKWKAAREYCADRGWQFLIYTEKELNIRW